MTLMPRETFQDSSRPLVVVVKFNSCYFFSSLVQPVANITCSGTTNRDFQCVCKGIVGNPPPSACWYSNSGQIGHFGYLENNLYIDNITRGESGTYMCKVKSHNLTDTQNITFGK